MDRMGKSIIDTNMKMQRRRRIEIQLLENRVLGIGDEMLLSYIFLSLNPVHPPEEQRGDSAE